MLTAVVSGTVFVVMVLLALWTLLLLVLRWRRGPSVPAVSGLMGEGEAMFWSVLVGAGAGLLAWVLVGSL